MVKHWLLLTLCIGVYCCTFSQNKQCDSIKNVLDNYTKDDTVKVKMLDEYSECLYNNNVPAAIYYAKQGIQLANEINTPGLACFGILNLSIFYGSQNHQDSAVLILLQGLNIVETNHLEDKLPAFYARLGESYRLLANTKQAEYYDYKFLEKAKQCKNDSMILSALQNLLALYQRESQFDKLDSLANVALPLARIQKDDYAFNKVLAIQGYGYLRLNKLQHAIDNFKTTLPMWKKLDRPTDEAFTQCLISSAFIGMNNKDSAGFYANAAMETAKKYDLKKETGDAYEALYYYYNYFGDIKKH